MVGGGQSVGKGAVQGVMVKFIRFNGGGGVWMGKARSPPQGLESLRAP